MATVHREIWTGEVIRGFNEATDASFLNGVKDYSRYVTGDDEVQVINNVYFNAHPEVLINNTTYPIPIQDLNGQGIPIVLDKYQTTATPVTDDELYALSYDKIGNVKQSHVEAILMDRLSKASHAFAPTSNTTKTPVIVTTGSATTTGRKRLRWEDIINLREKYGQSEIPVDGMRIVLCPDHVNDLLLEDKELFKVLTDWKTGKVQGQLGFEIMAYVRNPYYNVGTLTKLSFRALPTASDRMASVVFTPSLAARATGLTKMYWSAASSDPLYQRNIINFRNYFIALPQVNTAIGAIVSANS